MRTMFGRLTSSAARVVATMQVAHQKSDKKRPTAVIAHTNKSVNLPGGEITRKVPLIIDE